MDMKIKASLIVEKRNEKAWSQQHLADVSGLSLRTVQRVENTSAASPDSVKAIAMAFGLIPADLMEAKANPTKTDNPMTLAIDNPRKSLFLILSMAVALTVGASLWIAAGTSQQLNAATQLMQHPSADEQYDEAAEIAGQDWLSLVDKRDYALSWQQSSALFKSQVSEAQWVGAMEQVRSPLGEISTRDLKDIQFVSSLPGVPVGDYVVFTFSTHFENKPASIETLTLGKTDNEWQLLGYFIR